MSTYVLVPGGWHTGDLLADTAAPIEAAGHTVHRPTLVGNRPGDPKSVGLDDAIVSLSDGPRSRSATRYANGGRGRRVRIALTTSFLLLLPLMVAGQEPMPRVWLMSTPSTISANPDDRLAFQNYRDVPRLGGVELLEQIPEVERFASVSVDPQWVWRIDTPLQLRKLTMRVNEILNRPEIAGLVLAHGTNELEETAYWLNLTVKSSKPVVVVGAQRPYSTLSSDGPLNLLDAVRTAAHPDSAGRGVLVVLNGEINGAREVTKTNTYRVHTFRSRDLGLLGYADADKVVFYRQSTRRHTTDTEFDVVSLASFPRVSVLYVHTGVDDALVHAAVEAGAKGLVLAGTGSGAARQMQATLAAYAKKGIVVVRASRVGSGRVVRNDSWQEPGFVAADNLSPQKAWVLLTLGLAASSDPDRIQAMFDAY